MEIIKIDETNLYLVESFTKCELSHFFRYFKTRNIRSVFSNHIHTIIVRNSESGEIHGYGHLDKEGEKIWLGICVLESAQRKGIGKLLMDNLIYTARIKNLPEIYLTVDTDNTIAYHLYLKYKFIEIERMDSIIKMRLLLLRNIIELPVSYGEAFDKLSILDIKLQKIKDSRRDDVQIEYNAIYSQLNVLFNNDIQYYYKILKDINLKIWEMQDTFRDSTNHDEKNRLCNEIIVDNDRRFRVKHKINNSLSSHLKEQKGYKKKKAFILNHMSHGDMLTTNGMVRYYSTLYDEVTVACRKDFMESMSLVYADDPTIKLMSFNSWEAASPRFGLSMNTFNEITAGYDKIITGYNRTPFYGSFTDPYSPNDLLKLPFCFYHDVGIDKKIMWEYFHYVNCKQSIDLFNCVNEINDHKYIIIHENCSQFNGIITTETIESLLKIRCDDYIFINISRNIYPIGHKYYDIANKCVNKPIIYYAELLQHSYANILSNSVLFCLAIQLDIETDLNFCIGRSINDRSNFNYLWDSYPINKPVKRFRSLL
jgi:GNAT superfamily N-acetyltransferase